MAKCCGVGINTYHYINIGIRKKSKNEESTSEEKKIVGVPLEW